MAGQQLSQTRVTSEEVADREHIAELFEAQRARRWAAAATTAAERIAKLKRLKTVLLERSADLFAAVKADLGKHPSETEVTELQPVLSEINHTSAHLRAWMRPRRVATPLTLVGTRSEVRSEPKGVVLILAPWNYPFLLTIDPLIAAIAAGNTAIVKPSEKTPRTSAFMRELVAAVFEPNEAVVVEGEADTARALLELPFDHVFFTGSTRVGRIVMEAAAKHLASVTLELGGKSPAIVDEDADFAVAARRIVWGKFINAGQTCVAPDYVLVPESRRAEFVDHALSALGDEYGKTEEARRASDDFCRLVEGSGVARFEELVRDAVARGATVEVGGDGDAESRYFAPTLLSNVDRDALVMQDEIFGPVLPIVSYRTMDDALDFVRSQGKPLALYVFSTKNGAVERVLAQTTAGGTVVNNCVLHLANPDLPFGGVGPSGLGNYHGEFGFRTFSHERAVLKQGFPDTLSFLYPPYTNRVRSIIRAITRWHS